MRRGRTDRGAAGRRRRAAEAPALSEDEAAAVASLFAAELRRGWIPRERDLRAGAEAIARRRGRPAELC
ncbi:hypothetical protein [Nocardioides zeae]|uniref:Uncharacterized protein n=1 Tax=Nocardioides zeae TaxID=1457234 RepID=A0A6P0HLJ2_9ACTN|nr:hypothetical protein [Nocardioides zeae]NEN79124.1 hypothetical protein [Nocardioides zeae]